MPGLLIGFQTLPNLLLFLFLACISFAWALRYLKKAAAEKTPAAEPDLKPFIILNFLLLLAWVKLAGIDTDETEHLHCAWLISQGLVPFKDFWQHHSPLLWAALSPAFLKLRPTLFIFELSRAFSALIFTASAFLGWQIAKKTWGEKARVSLYLLILSSASISGEFLWLRPDLFMILFLLAGIWFFLDMPENRLAPSFFTGALFALALSFISKQFLMILLPAAFLLFLEKGRPRIAKLCAYLAGAACGAVPLLYYLCQKNIFPEFLFWVFQFNRKQMMVSALFPPAIFFMGAWGAYLLWKHYRRSGNKRALIIFYVLCTGTVNSLLGIMIMNGGYYLAFWYVLCAIAACGCDIRRVFGVGSSLRARAAVAGIFFGILLFPQLLGANNHKHTSLRNDKKAIAQLWRYCAGDSCVLFLSRHPVFCLDATRLYSDWQYEFVDRYACVKEDAKESDIAASIIRTRPAAIVFSLKQRYFVIELFQKGVISDSGCRELGTFLKANYTVKRIGGRKYYIRNDKL